MDEFFVKSFLFVISDYCSNNNSANFVFSGFSKEYSILGNELKENIIIKIKISDERLVGFYS